MISETSPLALRTAIFKPWSACASVIAFNLLLGFAVCGSHLMHRIVLAEKKMNDWVPLSLMHLTESKDIMLECP